MHNYCDSIDKGAKETTTRTKDWCNSAIGNRKQVIKTIKHCSTEWNEGTYTVVLLEILPVYL